MSVVSQSGPWPAESGQSKRHCRHGGNELLVGRSTAVHTYNFTLRCAGQYAVNGAKSIIRSEASPQKLVSLPRRAICMFPAPPKHEKYEAGIKSPRESDANEDRENLNRGRLRTYVFPED